MSNSSLNLKYAVGLVCVVVVGAADAAVSENSSAPKFKLGGFTAYPGIALAVKNDSNPFRIRVNEKHTVLKLSPSLLLEALSGANEFSLGYKGEVGRFSNSAMDNYVDHSFDGAAKLTISERASLNISPTYKKGHDDRGSTFNQAQSTSRNDWDSTGITGKFSYGSEQAAGRFELDAGYKDVRYTNNPTVTNELSKTNSDLGGTFFYRVMPKTSVFVQVTDTQISYKDAIAKLNQDGSERRYLAGVKWDATAQTSGSFKIGQQQRKFDNATKPDYSGGGWEGNVTWSPREVARVGFTTSRKIVDTSGGLGNFILSTNNLLTFAYDLSERTTLNFKASNASDDFTGSLRSDDTKTYGLNADYKVLKWLTGSVGYSDETRSSTTNPLTNNYNRRIVEVSLRTEL